MVTIPRIIVFLLATGSGLIFSAIEVKGGVTVRLFDLTILLAAVFFYAFILPKSMPVRGTVLFLAVATCYTIYLVVNGIFLRNMGTGVKEGFQLFLFLNFFIMLTYALRREETTRSFLKYLLIALWAVGIYNAIYHFSIGFYSGWKELDEPKLSHSVLMTVLAVVAMTYTGLSRGWRALFLVALLFLILSGERKGWLGAFFGVFMASLISSKGVLEKRALKRAFGLVGAFAVIIICILPFADRLPDYVERQLRSSIEFTRMVANGHGYLALLTADTTASNRARIFGIQQGIEMYSNNPAFGVGLTNYKRVVDQLNVDDLFKKGAHNEVLRIAAELGTVGLVLYFGMYAAAIARVRRVLPSMPYYTEDQQFRLRVGVALLAYGFAANLFLGGGGINLFLIFLPAALIHSVPALKKAELMGRQQNSANMFISRRSSDPPPVPGE